MSAASSPVSAAPGLSHLSRDLWEGLSQGRGPEEPGGGVPSRAEQREGGGKELAAVPSASRAEEARVLPDAAAWSPPAAVWAGPPSPSRPQCPGGARAADFPNPPSEQPAPSLRPGCLGAETGSRYSQKTRTRVCVGPSASPAWWLRRYRGSGRVGGARTQNVGVGHREIWGSGFPGGGKAL